MTTSIETIAVTPESGKHFMQGVAYAKKFGGKFAGGVWQMPVTVFGSANPVLVNPRNYYVKLVDAHCHLYTRDQGCPLHGETCAPEYR